MPFYAKNASFCQDMPGTNIGKEHSKRDDAFCAAFNLNISEGAAESWRHVRHSLHTGFLASRDPCCGATTYVVLFLRYFELETIILPRQVRDKREEKLKKRE